MHPLPFSKLCCTLCFAPKTPLHFRAEQPRWLMPRKPPLPFCFCLRNVLDIHDSSYPFVSVQYINVTLYGL
uniref:Secreted protein n=1 Tax=Steinernema glaseri TaxID=37863 RepID=A0A1I7ZCU1_9BILA